MKCFLDLDGVLVDFDGGVLKVHKTEDPFLKEENLGKWGTEDMYGLEPVEFWAPLGEKFWSNLDWTKEGKDILALVEDTFGYDNICLLTSPCLTKGSVSGKIHWINKHMPAYKKKFLIGFQKHFCANENTVLIDDRDKNVEDFRAHGGHAVLVPRPWNKSHGTETLPFLRNVLEANFGTQLHEANSLPQLQLVR